MGVLLGAGCWVYQIFVGIGVGGQNNPVHWGIYLVNFVFWVGIAHSGTLISAILHLFRAGWRNPIARAAETMTIFAVCICGPFSLYPSGPRLGGFLHAARAQPADPVAQFHLSPDVRCGGHQHVSDCQLPVLVYGNAAGSGHCPGPGNRDPEKIFHILSLGWTGAHEQWRHYARGYLFFAALATPLVISVHSVVSWDFALGVVPGWHTTIFAPYFVAGAIHSGLAMVLTLMIPLRKIFRYESFITVTCWKALPKPSSLPD